ncbi:MAG TPA: DUF2520 domain-containing protein [Candidatus Sphingobacterium stercorigallinarum]|nr:DUF2520 domain-containing protein [Candidatus Sphingobacterium stercorigallinarum]
MSIVMIGSGNLATQLAIALQNSGHQITQVWSRQLAHAEDLARRLSTEATDHWENLDKNADVYVLAVSDQAITEVAQGLMLNHPDALILHCSGATSMDVLSRFKNFGVLYPVQTFSKHIPIDFAQIPIGIEGNRPEAYAALASIANALSGRVFDCDSAQRLALHVSAVFANNFTNALLLTAADILAQHQLPFDILTPIIEETVEKAVTHHPIKVQTGPAVRDDQVTLEKHLNFLSMNPEWQLIYQKISDLIKKRKENNS